MRTLTAAFCLLSLLIGIGAGPSLGQNTGRSLVPERRSVFSVDTDYFGGDLKAILDTTLQSCQAACLADAACQAFTFNSRAGSCFPKATADDVRPYAGAISGLILRAAPDAQERAGRRAAELDFLRPADLDAALAQARGLSLQRPDLGDDEEALRAALAELRGNGDPGAARDLQVALTSLTDAPADWVALGRLSLALAQADSSARDDLASQAVSATINAYLRSDAPDDLAVALAAMAMGLEAAHRGALMIPALRRAAALRPDPATTALLADAVARHGFRVTGHEVQNESAAPRLCAVFSAPVKGAGTDFAPFVRLPEPALTVTAEGAQVCVEGVRHGQHYRLGLRAGLPAEDGEVLASDVTLDLYVRDRSPAVRFPGRAYVLPRAAGAGIPVETVNATRLDLVLLRVSDRNLIRAIQDDSFGRPLDYWSAEVLRDEIAEDVWRGTAEVASEVNRDTITRLPVDEALAGLGAGIYVLQAALPGVDPYDSPAAMQWFVISDLGMTTLAGGDGLHVFLRSLKDAAALEGVTLTLVSRANAVIGTTTTDEFGHALFGAAMTAGQGGAAPALITAATGEDIAFLSLTDPAFDLSDRGVAGHDPAPPIDLFLATDRGAYRAGETVRVTLLARDPMMRAIEGLPLTLRLMRPDGVEYARTLPDHAGAGGHVAALALAGSAPRGTWRIEAFLEEDRILASEPILVEDFLPERIDFTLALPEGPLRQTDRPEIAIAARHLYGAPGAGLKIEGDVRLAAVDAVADFPGYRFGRHDAPFSPITDSLPDDTATDDAGAAALAAPLPDPGPEGNRPLEARFAIRLSESSNRPVERRITRLLLPDRPVIGIRPGFEGDSLAEGAEARFDLIALGPDARPAAMAVHWVLNRMETDYQWYSLYGNWNWEATTTRTRIAEGDLALAAGGPGSLSAAVGWGDYELVAEAADGSGTVASIGFSAGWYQTADTAATPDTLEMSLDKPAYRPGDTAMLRLVPRAAGVALISVLSDRLIAMQAVPVHSGENLVPIAVTADWGAGAYVTVSALRPMAEAAGRSPVRALGLAHATVDPGPRRLEVAIEAPAEADPRGPLPVAIKVAGGVPGEPAFVTIAAVDQGILGLTGFADPDPEDHYFGQRRLGVAIRDIYGRLIDGQNGAVGIVRSGGDAAAAMTLKAPPPTEELVAYFAGPVVIGADGYARTTFTLPAFNGTVRLMAVAWSASAVGQAGADVLVRDPVVVSAALPRFLAPGDESRLHLDLSHVAGPAGAMALGVEAPGLRLGPVPATVNLAAGGRAEISIPLSAPDGAEFDTDVAEIRVLLTTPDGRILTRTLALPLQSNDPAISRQNRFTLAPGESLTLDGNILAGLAPDSVRATLALGPIARFDAPGLLGMLDRYPYGCTEQLASRALPLLYFDQIAAAVGAAGDGDIAARIAGAIDAILLNQSANGAFGLWQPDQGDLWLDAYVGDFLSRARAQGHAVPDTAFRSAMDNLRNQVNYAADLESGGGAIAYALMVLAREGGAAVGDLRYYADVKAAAFDTPIAAAQLGAALASYGDQVRADAMFGRAARLIDAAAGRSETSVWRDDYGTRLRDAGAVLALATEAGSAAVDRSALERRLATGIAGRNLSTQEAAWSLLAAHAVIGAPGAADFTMDGAPTPGPVLGIAGRDVIAAPRVLTNAGASPAEVTLTIFGRPTEPEPAGGKGYIITRRWFTLDGAETVPERVAQGTRLVTVIEVTALTTGAARLMVSDPLPAGFEIDNPSLLRGGDIAALGWLDPVADTRMAEFRQDRFLAAIDWGGTGPLRVAYVVRAVSPGRFHLPAASVEDMYRPDFRARTAAGSVTVTE